MLIFKITNLISLDFLVHICYNDILYNIMGRCFVMLDNLVQKVLVSEEEIAEIVSRLGEEINRDYSGEDKKLVIVSVLKGAMPFTTDLMKKLNVVLELECIKASSYGMSTESSGKIKMNLDFNRDDIAECDCLIVEDIVDSGNTLKFLVEHLKNKGAKSVKTCTLLDKPSRRKVDFEPDYKGKVIPDEFVFGYGLDLFEQYRNLPYVAVVNPEYIKDHV